MATYVCLLSIFLCSLQGIERFQAREIQTFIEETEQRQGDAAWMIHLTSLRRQQRLERMQSAEQIYPPLASDHTNEKGTARPAQVSLRPSAPVIAPPPPPSPPLQPTPRSSSSFSESASASASSSVQSATGFPAFGHTVYPVSRVPNWGAMRSPMEWNRPYSQLEREDFVRLPPYNLQVLRMPLTTLVDPILPENIPILTAKLTYSTRYYGAYDLDAGEFTGMHPGIDLKLAFGTPLGALAGGRVYAVNKDAALGLHVIIEHRLPQGETFFSIYGHLDVASVREGQDVRPGQAIGNVGMTGNTTAPHVHLQVDRDDGERPHQRYWPAGMPSRAEADRHTMHPLEFIRRYSAADQA